LPQKFSATVTPVIIEARRKDESLNGSKTEGLLRQKVSYKFMGIAVVLQHRGMGSEHRSLGESTIHRSGHSSARFLKHKKQLQRKFVN
jgi:hypothetical protein